MTDSAQRILSLASRAFAAILLLSGSLLLWACSRPEEQKSQAAAPAPKADAVPSGPPAYEGCYDVTNCNGIMAWAWDMNRPNDPVRVDIYDGDARIATVTADEFREDLRAAGKGNGKHSLTLPTPAKMKDGKPHRIFMRFAGTSQELANGPKEINCNLEQ